VKVVEDALGWVFSEHTFLETEDEATAGAMRNSGVQQIAYALLTEALRREVYLCLLAEMTKHPNSLHNYAQGDDDYRKLFATGLANAAFATVMGLVQKMLPDITREVLEMGTGQLDGHKKPSSE
jgi:hypothetical protein